MEEEQGKPKILKKVAIKFMKIIISTDMTLKQKELDKILREELKMRRNVIYGVRV